MAPKVLKKPAARKNWQPKKYYPIPGYAPYVVAKLPRPRQHVGEGGVFQHVEYGICHQSTGQPRSNRDEFGDVKSFPPKTSTSTSTSHFHFLIPLHNSLPPPLPPPPSTSHSTRFCLQPSSSSTSSTSANMLFGLPLLLEWWPLRIWRCC